MSNVNTHVQSFAGGEVGSLMVGRLDVASYQASGELFDNFLPLAQGPMTRRNGFAYLDSWGASALYNRILKFEYDIGQNYLLSPRAGGFYFYSNDAELLLPETQPGAFTYTGDASGAGSSIGGGGGNGGGGGFSPTATTVGGNGGNGSADLSLGSTGPGGGGGGGAGITLNDTAGNGGNGGGLGGGGGGPGLAVTFINHAFRVSSLGTPGSGAGGGVVITWNSGANSVAFTTPGATTWTVPSDWTNSSNTISAIGGGAAGNATLGAPLLNSESDGGGGGAFASLSNVTLTPGATVYLNIGAGGTPSSINGGDTWVNISSNAAPANTSQGCLAKGASGTTGGQASASIGTTKYSGGSAGSSTIVNGSSFGGAGGPGGGGAGGPSGTGASGGSTPSAYSGAGGGGSNGGSAGVSSSGTAAGPGGNGASGFGGGAGGTALQLNGSNGAPPPSSTGGAFPLISHGSNAAVARFTASIRSQDAGVVHVATFQIMNQAGGVGITANFGTSAGDNSLGTYTDLKQGFHQLAFVPPLGVSTVYFELRNLSYGTRVVTAPTWLYQQPTGTGAVPYTLPYLAPQMSSPKDVRCAQDGNELWLFSNLTADNPSVIQRRGVYSWSNIAFLPDDGPFGGYGDPSISFSVSDVAGQQTLTMYGGTFASFSAGQLLRLFHQGQYVKEVIARDSYYTQPIRVSGIGIDRNFTLTIAGTFSGTITLQRSVGVPGEYVNVLTYSGATSATLNDVLSGNALYTASQSTGNWDNSVAYYRLAITPGNYTSGAATVSLQYGGGSTVGIARINTILSPTTALVDITSPFGATTKTNIWQAGAWAAGFSPPQLGCFGKGRLWTAYGRQPISSNSDAYFSFTDGLGGSTATTSPEADNTSIDDLITTRSATISWMACLDYLCIGTRREELVASSAVPTEALTPTTFNADFMTQVGGAQIDPLTLAYSIIFADKTARRLYKFSHNLHSLSSQAFIATDLTRLHPEMCKAGIVRYDATEEPERRVYVVLNDGTVRALLYREEEQIAAWSRITTTIGRIVDVVVLHEADEDRVYFLIATPTPSGATPYTYTLVRMPRETPVNPWDHRYLDNHLTTPYRQGSGFMLPSALTGAVTVYSDLGEFQSSDVGKVLWLAGGRVQITSYTSAYQVAGNVLSPLSGTSEQLEDEDPDNETDASALPLQVPATRWMIAAQTSTVSVPSSWAGKSVSIYADLVNLGSFTVPSGGVITLPGSFSRVVVGQPMRSRWRSLKLAYGAQKGTAIGQKKKVVQLLLLLDTAGDGLQMGRSFNYLTPLQTTHFDPNATASPPFFTGELENAKFNSEYATDPRICFEIDNASPCTVVGFVANIETRER